LGGKRRRGPPSSGSVEEANATLPVTAGGDPSPASTAQHEPSGPAAETPSPSGAAGVSGRGGPAGLQHETDQARAHAADTRPKPVRPIVKIPLRRGAQITEVGGPKPRPTTTHAAPATSVARPGSIATNSWDPRAASQPPSIANPGPSSVGTPSSRDVLPRQERASAAAMATGKGPNDSRARAAVHPPERRN